MARKSIIEREKKKIKLVDKYASKRAALKQEQKQAATFEEKMDIQRKLQKLPRNSNPTRVVRRCALTGRPKGCLLYTSPSPRDSNLSRMPSSA